MSYGGFLCVDPRTLKKACDAATPPIQTDTWFGTTGRFLSPIGLMPGRVKILLLDDAVRQLDPCGSRALIFTEQILGDNGSTDGLSLPNLRMVGTPINLTAGVPGQGVFLVELADRRIDCEGIANRRYNWRDFPDSDYDTTTKNGSSPWTWTELLTDLWNGVGNLGTFPGLPTTINGTPEQIDAQGVRAADVLEDLLALNLMAVRYNNLTDAFSIVWFGSTASDQLLTQFVDDNTDYLIWDQSPIVASGSPSNLSTVSAQTPVQSPAGLVSAAGAAAGAAAQAGALKASYASQSGLPATTGGTVPEYLRVIFPVWAPVPTDNDPATVFVVDVKWNASTELTTLITNSGIIRTGTYAMFSETFPARVNSAGAALNATDAVTRAKDVAWDFYVRCMRAASHFSPLAMTYSGVFTDDVLLPGLKTDVVSWEDVGDAVKTCIYRGALSGFPTIFEPATADWPGTAGPFPSGSLLAGGTYSRMSTYPTKTTADNPKWPVARAGNIPPSVSRIQQVEQRTSSDPSDGISQPLSLLAGGRGLGPILRRGGPLRQWDSQVIGLGENDGVVGRPWRSLPRALYLRFVRVTSTTPSSGRYPAKEELYDPATDTWSDGDTCWFIDGNGDVPTASRSLGMLVGYASSHRVYINAFANPITGTVSGAITIDDDKTHSFSGITEVQLNNSVATNAVGTKAIWQIDDASATAPGIVNLSAQTLGDEDKSFKKSVFINIDGNTAKFLDVKNTLKLRYLDDNSLVQIGDSALANISCTIKPIAGGSQQKTRQDVNGVGYFWNTAFTSLYGNLPDVLNQDGLHCDLLAASGPGWSGADNGSYAIFAAQGLFSASGYSALRIQEMIGNNTDGFTGINNNFMDLLLNDASDKSQCYIQLGVNGAVITGTPTYALMELGVDTDAGYGLDGGAVYCQTRLGSTSYPITSKSAGWSLGFNSFLLGNQDNRLVLPSGPGTANAPCYGVMPAAIGIARWGVWGTDQAGNQVSGGLITQIATDGTSGTFTLGAHTVTLVNGRVTNVT